MPIRSNAARIRRNERRCRKRRDERETRWNYLASEATERELAGLPRCAACGRPITRARRSTRRCCGGGCRQQAYRDRARVVAIEQSRGPRRG